MSRQRITYCLCALLVIIAGVASRAVHSGMAVLDNDLGSALYAVLAYLLLGIVRPRQAPARKALVTLAAMLAIEAFQLAPVLDRFAASENIMLRLLAVVFGTTWSWRDLLGYAAGVAAIAPLDYCIIAARD
jgi:hypothetical protein